MLSVLSVAYPLATVSPDAVGGAEQVVAALDAALAAAGHRSTLLAAAGSRAQGRLVSVPPPEGALDCTAIARVQGQLLQQLERLTAEQHFDVIHFHGCDCARYLLEARLPASTAQLVTLHVPRAWYDERLFRLEQPRFVCVSAWQRASLEAEGASVHETLQNGVDLRRWRPLSAEQQEPYVLCLGRICPEKGFDRALRAAHQADVPLVLAGHVYGYPDHLRHFEREILPLLDSRRRFVGAVGGAHKRRLLAAARCLVVPSRVAETSSLVTMEALACGTPVIVSCPGAPASLIEPEVTGLVALSERELAQALVRVTALERAACRRSAERRFDVACTAAGYLKLYQQLAHQSGQAPRRPAAVELVS